MATSLGELIALVRVNPGKYSFAIAGIGTPNHLLGEQLKLSLKLDLADVPAAFLFVENDVSLERFEC